MLKGGGAPCPPAVYWAVRDEMGVTVAHDYGMTEVPMICVASPLDTDEQLANSDGKPIPGNEVRIVDDSAVLPAGAEGEIQVRGAAVCHGYTDPSLDADAFTADGWFRTGDRGHLRPDGHVEVTGRTKDLIIRKGEKIAPLELETLLIEHPAVAEVAVLGLPDDERGERVCAVLVTRSDASAPSLDEVSSFLRAKGLMPQKLPEQVEIVSELPRTGLGKVAKLALRDKFSGCLTPAEAAQQQVREPVGDLVRGELVARLVPPVGPRDEADRGLREHAHRKRGPEFPVAHALGDDLADQFVALLRQVDHLVEDRGVDALQPRGILVHPDVQVGEVARRRTPSTGGRCGAA